MELDPFTTAVVSLVWREIGVNAGTLKGSSCGFCSEVNAGCIIITLCSCESHLLQVTEALIKASPTQSTESVGNYL
jgi:hypothetical protein